MQHVFIHLSPSVLAQSFFAPVIDFQRIINIRGREHIFRFYNEIGKLLNPNRSRAHQYQDTLQPDLYSVGGVCYYSPLPLCRCNPLVMEGI